MQARAMILAAAISMMVAPAFGQPTTQPADDAGVPDLSQYDADTLRTLCENLYRRVRRLEGQNAELRRELAEAKRIRDSIVDGDDEITPDESRGGDAVPDDLLSKMAELGAEQKAEMVKRLKAVDDPTDRIENEARRFARQLQRSRGVFVPSLAPWRLESGQVGVLRGYGGSGLMRPMQLRAVSVPSESEVLAVPATDHRYPMWISGVDAKDLVDGQHFRVRKVLRVSGTKRYTAADGAAKTVRHLEPAAIELPDDAITFYGSEDAE